MACQLHRVLADCAKDHHFLFQAATQNVPLLLQVKPRLKIEPKSLGRSKITGQAQGSVSCDTPGTMNDLIDPSRRNTDVLSYPILRNRHRLEKIMEQNFAWVNRSKFTSGHRKP